MPCKCCIPFCKGNYPTGPKVSVFSFPKDKEFLQKWLCVIQRKDFYPNKHSRVCSLHFQESDFERETSAYDPKTGRTLTAPLGNIRLKKNAVPSLFNLNYPNKPLNEEDQEDGLMRNERFSPRLQQNIRSPKPKSSHLKNKPKSNMPVESEHVDNLKKKRGRKKKRPSVEKTTDEVNDSSKKCCLNNNQETLSNDNLVDKNCSLSKSSQCLPAVAVKVEKPWEKEYNYYGNPSEDKSKDCEEIQIEIKDVWSVSSSSSEKVDKSKAKITGSSSVKKPLSITKREEMFGKLIACEMSDLCKSPELYLKTKQAILDILVQAHYEQIKCDDTVL